MYEINVILVAFYVLRVEIETDQERLKKHLAISPPPRLLPFLKRVLI